MLDILIYGLLFLLALLCFICGFQFAHQKWGTLIAGYNDLTEKQKLAVDFKAISRSASRCAFAGGTYILFIGGFLYLISNNVVKGSFATFLFAVPSLLFLLYIMAAVIKSAKFYKVGN